LASIELIVRLGDATAPALTFLNYRELSFQAFQKGDEVADLVGIEAELRHGRMAGDDAFRQCFLQHFDRIMFVQGAETAVRS
jgi:hypothetical protein